MDNEEEILFGLLGKEWYEIMFGDNIIEETKPEESHPTPAVEDSEKEIQKLIQLNSNKNTTKSTCNWIKKFSEWATARGINPKLEEISEDELDGVLQKFYCEVRRRDGENYEPDSLRVMHAALDRHLKDKGCKFSITKDRQFATSRKVYTKWQSYRTAGVRKRKAKEES